MDKALETIFNRIFAALSAQQLVRTLAAAALVLALVLVLAACGSTRGPSGAAGSSVARAPHVPLASAQADSIAIHALGLVGTPYRYGGNTPDTGFDCSGLIGYVYRSEVGTPPPRTVARLGAWGEPVAQHNLRTGDLVIFGRSRAPHHAGIYVGNGRFVHAPSSGGTVRLDVLTSGYWARQNAAFRRP